MFFYGPLIFEINQLSATVHDRCRDKGFMLLFAKSVARERGRERKRERQKQSRQTIKHKQTRATHGAQSRPYASVSSTHKFADERTHTHTQINFYTHTHTH